MFSSEKRIRFGVALAVLSLAGVAQAQVPNQKPQSSWAGKYEATVKVEGVDEKLGLDLVEDAGKFSGTFTTVRGSYKVLKSQLADGTLTLEIEKPSGPPGTISFRQDGDNLIATFSEAGKTATVEFRKVVADEISGEWDAVADASGQAFPFTLTLKLEGDKVTGSSSSQLGTSNVSSGSWKDGKLTVILDGGQGQVGLIATIVEGKLSGDYDYAGQLQGKWVAIRKK
jgi:hypothetical protein